jgi:hypothetical protein
LLYYPLAVAFVGWYLYLQYLRRMTVENQNDRERELCQSQDSGDYSDAAI